MKFVTIRRALLVFNALNGSARRMADVESEIKSRIVYVKYLTFLTSKDYFLVAAKNGPKSRTTKTRCCTSFVIHEMLTVTRSWQREAR